MKVKLALPKGQLQENTAELLQQAGLSVSDYHDGSRSYRPQCKGNIALQLKVFHEKDIAIQVAIGNYDLGICRLDWIEELLTKYHGDAVVKVRDLGFGARSLYAAVSSSSEDASLEVLKSQPESLRLVSEYPNLAESFALKQRLRKFRIFPVWGSSAVYMPEHAELALVSGSSSNELKAQGIIPVATILEGGAYLIANRNSLERKNLGQILAAISSVETKGPTGESLVVADEVSKAQNVPSNGSIVSLALPDGHQQRHAVDFLNRVGLKVEGYNVGEPTSRPDINIDGVMVKVIRPQDMPLQVANGNFDLAITGRDWLRDHRFQFPSSPVREVHELGFGKVRIVSVVTQEMPVSTTHDLKKLKRGAMLRVASEYTNIADKYAHDNHLAPYKVVPTWGATEAFLPEDADVLIENTETGSTIARNNLKIIDTLFESVACLIGNTEAMGRTDKKEKITYLIESMRPSAEG